MSSSEDDDDLLLSVGPTFKSTRQQKAADRKLNKMNDYLASCLDSANERFDRRRRMQEKSSRTKKETLAAVTQGNMDVELPFGGTGTTSTSSNTNSASLDDSGIDWDKLDTMVKEAEDEKAVHRKKKKQCDIDGMDDSDFEGEEFEGLTYSQKVALAGARETGLSTGLGARFVLNNFVADRDNRTYTYSFVDFEAAMVGMEQILANITNEKVLTLLATANAQNKVPALLYRRNLVSAYQADGSKPPPPELLSWLLKVSLSGTRCGELSATGSCRTLTGLISIQTAGCLQMFHFRDFLPCLTETLGYIDSFGNDVIVDGLTSKRDKQYRHSVDSKILRNFLNVWNCALMQDCVQWNNDNRNEACSCLGALVKISVDAIFHSPSKNVLSCGELLNHVKDLVRTMILFVFGKLEKLGTKNNKMMEWLEYDSWSQEAVQVILQCVSNLSSGINGSEDFDDTSGSLPIALSVRNFPTTIEHDDSTQKGAFSVPGIFLPCAVMRMMLARKALQQCLVGHEKKNYSSFAAEWNKSHKAVYSQFCGDRIQATTAFTLQERYALEALFDGLLAFSEIYKKADEMMANDSPRFHACVDIADCICDTARLLLVGCNRITEDYLDVLHSVHEKIGEYCGAMKRNVTSVFTHPHLRRAKELLTILSLFFRRLTESYKKGMSSFKRDRKQQKMASYFSPGTADS